MELNETEVQVLRHLMADVDGLCEDMAEDDSYTIKIEDVKNLAIRVGGMESIKYIDWDGYAKQQKELFDG